MASDAMQRIKQLERSVNTLARDLALLRNQRSSAVGAIEPVIVRLTANLAARAVSGSNYTITYASAQLWDISRITGSTATMKLVEDGSDPTEKRTVKVGNLWDHVIQNGDFVFAVPYKSNYLVCAPIGMELYRFTLNVALTTGTADADILLMDGTDTLIDDDVLDPLGIFSTLGIHDAGLCLKYQGKYYVIQAPCPA